MQGTVVRIAANVGDAVASGKPVIVLESMKMEHDIVAPAGGVVTKVLVAEGATVEQGARLFVIDASEETVAADATVEAIDLDAIRPDLAEVVARHETTLDEARPDAVERRRKTAQRTARENVMDLVDDGSFVEYAPLVIAAQRRRRPVDDLIKRTPGDGMVCGTARINGDLFEDEAARCIVMSYDYTVLAGTQGMQNH